LAFQWKTRQSQVAILLIQKYTCLRRIRNTLFDNCGLKEIFSKRTAIYFLWND
jgi:hypothetical protein